MSPREGMYYVGMIGGMVGGVTFARSMDWHPIVGLLCGLAAGVPLGMVCERLYTQALSKPKFDSLSSQVGAHVICQNSTCQWSGDPGYSSICPRCGQELPRGR